jgi:hypothetical protein
MKVLNHHPRLLWRWSASSANTTVTAAVATTDWVTGPLAPPVLLIMARAAVATWLTGLTKTWSGSGRKMLLAN